MATVTRGRVDELVGKIKRVLDEYEDAHPAAAATLYRQNNASIRIRIVDQGFEGWSRPKRHDHAWKFIADRLNEDDIQEISVLLLLTPAELKSSFLNVDFDDPLPSAI